MKTLTDKQLEVLRAGIIGGVSIKYETVWLLQGRPVTSTVKSLIRRGLMSSSYYSGGEAAANLTDVGRTILKEIDEES